VYTNIITSYCRSRHAPQWSNEESNEQGGTMKQEKTKQEKIEKAIDRIIELLREAQAEGDTEFCAILQEQLQQLMK